MKNGFSGYHPLVIFIYFVAVITVTVIFSHPLMTAISLCSAFILSAIVNGVKASVKQLLYSIPTVIIFAVMSPLFNHRGDNPYIYINDVPITIEAVLYGIYTGALVVSMVLWFGIFGVTLGKDKFNYLFGRKFPQLSLLVTMIIGFIPYFKIKLDEIVMVQKTLGVTTKEGTLKHRLTCGSCIISALVSVTLEDTIETADSMTARGFSLSGKTSRGCYKFRVSDAVLCLVITIFCVLAAWIYISKSMYFSFFPSISSEPFTLNQAVIMVLLGLFFNLSLIIIVLGELRWKLLRSKI